MTDEASKTRAALALAIKDADAADAVAVKARDAVKAASTNLSQAERDLAAARAALEEARGVRRPLAELLASAGSDEERWATVDEYNIPRPALTAEELRDARALVLDSEDRVIVARSELEQLQSSAASATAAANRADARRQEAIREVVRPEAIRLMERVQGLTAELAEARLAMRFVGGRLVAPLSDERRQADRLLNSDPGTMFPLEMGFKAPPSEALAAWQAFAGEIEHNSSAPFPTS
jgi:hypothetical protein